jgi:hypothetical protein
VCADLQHDAGLLETFVPTPFSLNMSLFYLPLAFAELQYVQQLMRCPRHACTDVEDWEVLCRINSSCPAADETITHALTVLDGIKPFVEMIINLLQRDDGDGCLRGDDGGGSLGVCVQGGIYISLAPRPSSFACH